MGYEIKPLDLMDCTVESSFLVLARGMAVQVDAKIYAIPGPEVAVEAAPVGAHH